MADARGNTFLKSQGLKFEPDLGGAPWPGLDLMQGAFGLGIPGMPGPDTIQVTDMIAGSARGSSGGGGGGTGGGSPALLATYTSGAPGAYNITITFKGTWTTAFQNIFIGAANRISAIVVGDIPDVRTRSGIVDDITISAELKAIDGVGGILGQAGPTSLRSVSYLPATAMMQFDSADAQQYLNAGLFDEIVTHEMLHSIGFGTIWANLGLTRGPSFIGANAVGVYNKMVDNYAASHGGSTTLANGTVLTRGAVPLETTGGPGTAGAHWSEVLFDTELMTGYLDVPTPATAAVPDPLSALTVASLKDLGYVVSAIPPIDPYKLI